MKEARILALIGAAILFAGVFTPLASAPIMGNITYFSNGRGAGIAGALLVALALAGGGLALSDRERDVAWPGAGALAVIAFSFFMFERRLGEMRAHMEHRIVSRLLRGLADMAVDTVQLQWGWAVLVAGALLLVCAGLMARRQSGGVESA